MKKVRTFKGGISFWCPGCKTYHRIPTSGEPKWGYNGNQEKPTLTPSILVRHPMHVPPVTAENLEQWNELPWEQKVVELVCHSYVTDGKISFLSDCTHEFRGQTVELRDED